MKKLVLVLLSVMLAFTACKKEVKESEAEKVPVKTEETVILLSDTEIKADGAKKDSVTIANDIIYYEKGHDFTYGEGGENDAHSKEEAELHRVVHITEAGTYRIKGKLSHGQIAVDLGENAEDNPEAVVTLILDGADVTSTVAPAIIFYNVYECGDKDNATKDVDLSGAGARIILEKDSVNTVNGSYVAKIYKPETVIDGNVEDAKKLHKYDAAFYSKMSMVVDGEGTLNINAENEGLDSELHLTINGGTVIASACAKSEDAGIDSDKGIHVNGGTVIAGGSMLDRIEEGGQTFVVFNFQEKQNRDALTLKNEAGDVIFSETLPNAFKTLIFSSPSLAEGAYTLWQGDTQLQGSKTSSMGGFNGGRFPSGFPTPEGMEMPEDFNPEKIPEFKGDIESLPPSFEKGEFTPPDRIPPEKELEHLEKPDGDKMPENVALVEVISTEFVIEKGANYFRIAN